MGWLTDGTAVPMAGLMLLGALLGKTADLLRPREAGALSFAGSGKSFATGRVER